MKRHLALVLIFPALLAAQAPVDYRTELTPLIRKAAERKLYTLSPEAQAAGRKRWKRAWIASWAAFAAANVLDARSSTGKLEGNPLLQRPDGTFATGKAAAIKAGAGGALLGMQLWMIHKKPEQNLYKSFSFVNGAAAGALGVVAATNAAK